MFVMDYYGHKLSNGVPFASNTAAVVSTYASLPRPLHKS